MWGLNRLGYWLRSPLFLSRVQLPEQNARVAVAMAAAFNVVGMPMQVVISSHTPRIPLWPECLSIAVGIIILGLALLNKFVQRTDRLNALFIINAAFVSFALYVDCSYFDGTQSSLPFQATKVGAIVAGMLAPGFFAGLAAIVFHVGTPILQFLHFPPRIQAAIRSHEPWALLGFGLAACIVLAYRFRVRQLELEAIGARANAELTQRLAQAFLELRDLMNTPIQSIEIASSLLGQDDPDQKTILRELQKSCDRLRELNHLLKKYEHQLEWKTERGGL